MRTFTTTVTAAAAAALLLTGCSGSMSGGHGMASPSTSTTGAATLRTGLNTIFAEHVVLASAATGAALDGRDAEFKAAAGALDANSIAIGQAIGSVYGKDAEAAFLPLWRRHIGFAVDYTTGVAAGDRAKQDKAVSDLVAYSQDFGAFLASANPNLPKSVVAELVKHHVVTLKDVIDAQAARDHGRAYAAMRTASAHMAMIADPLAAAIAKQFPDRFPGASTSVSAGLRTTLNVALREHVYLAAFATGAALGGRDAEFKAAANALDANSVAIAQAIGSVYGKDAEAAFLPLWPRHIGFAVDYTTGVAPGDRTKQDRAVSDLVAYSQDFGAFLASANPNLPKSVVADLVKHHVVTLKSVVDAQAAKDYAKAYAGERTAAGHMQQIADPLAEAIVKQFPDRYRG
ncbi:MAG TPA: copper amine oxidase N-terminal domain-containing protein [Patescibacteria group bacterium]|nr:copper amine oxidase N-terminal domain-containing protein [Patescibacteria group bacterium]